MKMIRVSWTDATSTSTWLMMEEAKGLRVPSVSSLGYLIKIDAVSVVLAGGFTIDEDGDVQTLCHMVIPRRMISSICYLDRGTDYDLTKSVVKGDPSST